MKHKKGKGTALRRKIGYGMIFAGVLLIAAVLTLYLREALSEYRADLAAEAALAGLKEEIQELQALENEDNATGAEEFIYVQEETDSGQETDADADEAETPEMDTVEIDGYLYIGYLSVPSLGLEIPVMADWTMESLDTAPGRYSGTLAGKDLVIAGHNYRRHFSQLKWADGGTVIVFTDVHGTSYYYEILRTETLQPTQISEMTGIAGTDDWDMTLFTCTTGGRARCAIRCVRTDG
ncbi:MAG: sortase [Lachnospiraceae bacterium]|nr:sortase [Lachnospiraceae bacterium]